MTRQYGKKNLLENLAKDNQLFSFKHNGFWHPMDTLRDKIYLDSLWESKRLIGKYGK